MQSAAREFQLRQVEWPRQYMGGVWRRFAGYPASTRQACGEYTSISMTLDSRIAAASPLDERLACSRVASADASVVRGMRAKGSGGWTEKITGFLKILRHAEAFDWCVTWDTYEIWKWRRTRVGRSRIVLVVLAEDAYVVGIYSPTHGTQRFAEHNHHLDNNISN